MNLMLFLKVWFEGSIEYMNYNLFLFRFNILILLFIVLLLLNVFLVFIFRFFLVRLLVLDVGLELDMDFLGVGGIREFLFLCFFLVLVGGVLLRSLIFGEVFFFI